jgi:phosphoglycolate phosphatase
MLVAFDLDGTLADTRRDLADSVNEMLAECGAGPLDEARVGRMVGTGAPELVARAAAAAGIAPVPPDALTRFLAIYDRRLLVHTRLYPGIPEVLAELHSRVTLALLTNKPLDQSLRTLDAFGLTRYFPYRAAGDGPWPRKPDPAGLRWLMQQADETPERTLMIGDSLVDLATGRRAEAKVCLARYGFGFADIPPEEFTGDAWIADTPLAIPDIVAWSVGGVPAGRLARSCRV